MAGEKIDERAKEEKAQGHPKNIQYLTYKQAHSQNLGFPQHIIVMRTLFVTQLHPSVTERRLRSVFEKYGPIKRTNIIAYPWKKNCAFVEFEHETDTQDALVDMNLKDFPDKWKWKACYARSNERGERVC